MQLLSSSTNLILETPSFPLSLSSTTGKDPDPRMLDAWLLDVAFSVAVAVHQHQGECRIE
jgi:hypothetical protein